MTGRALVANGDVNDLNMWGGHPFFFLQAGKRNGLFSGGVAVHRDRLRYRRLLWNALRPVRFERPRGYQYSRGFGRQAWSERSGPEVSEYVSHFPLLPPPELVREGVTYYLDATLHQNFDSFLANRVPRRVQVEALARERDAYAAARFVVGWSNWCADDLRSFYGLPEEKVRVIAPGANLGEAEPDPLPWDGSLSPLRLGLIGANWKQKGGLRLLEAATALERMGHDVEVVVVGPAAAELPQHPAVRATGFIDKTRELERFVGVIRSLHFGCLLSSEEAYGISNLECIRLGVPVICTAVGGSPETVPPGAGLVVTLEQTGEEIAEAVDAVVRTPAAYAGMRRAAQDAAPAQSWNRTADEFLSLLESRPRQGEELG